MKYVFILALLLSCLVSSAQSTAGLTGVRDTSFTVAAEYLKLKKNYPDISIAAVLPRSGVKQKTDITYCSRGQRKLLLDAFLPSAKSKAGRTAILIIHGGGWRSGNRQQHHALAQELATRGYVCFTPEYRLSTEALYPAAVHDLKAALRWIHANAKDYGVDTNKIAVAGFSAGGELAALVGATAGDPSLEGEGCHSAFSSRLQAIIDMDGTLSFVHPESGEGDDSKKTSAATYWFGYSKKDNPELWKQASPLTHAGRNTPPTLFINSSVARMHAGRDDYIRLMAAFGIYTEVKTFSGAPHAYPLFHPWFDTTVQVMDDFLKKLFQPVRPESTVIVAQDGSGDYRTVQAALNAVPLNNKFPLTIFIKKGVYKEKLHLDSSKDHVTLIGEDRFGTILTYDDHTGRVTSGGDTVNTRTSWSFRVLADDFTAKELSFQNDAGFAAGQAVALESDGDRAVFRNCRFLGFQDVLFTNSDRSRQYYENCYIEGTTDFIFGSATVWFERCHIHSKKNSHITAASTPPEKEFGYVFNDCVLTGDSSLHGVSLGRPWRPYAQVTYLRCYIGQHIKAEGWSNWNNTDNYQTARYREYKNYGPSSDASQRLKWTRQLSDAEAARYTCQTVLQGWDPQKGPK